MPPLHKPIMKVNVQTLAGVVHTEDTARQAINKECCAVRCFLPLAPTSVNGHIHGSKRCFLQLPRLLHYQLVHPLPHILMKLECNIDFIIHYIEKAAAHYELTLDVLSAIYSRNS